MNAQVLSLLVSNHFGVLTRVTNLFSRRGFNIRELSVGETDDPSLSRITILTEGDDEIVEQIQKQLMKLEDVKKVILLPDAGFVGRELLLLKIGYDESCLLEINQTIDQAHGKILHRGENSLIIEITGETPHIDAFVLSMKKHKLMEMCRTGVTALQTGVATIYDETNY